MFKGIIDYFARRRIANRYEEAKRIRVDLERTTFRKIELERRLSEISNNFTKISNSDELRSYLLDTRERKSLQAQVRQHEIKERYLQVQLESIIPYTPTIS